MYDNRPRYTQTTINVSLETLVEISRKHLALKGEIPKKGIHFYRDRNSLCSERRPCKVPIFYQFTANIVQRFKFFETLYTTLFCSLNDEERLDSSALEILATPFFHHRAFISLSSYLPYLTVYSPFTLYHRQSML